MRKKCFFRFIRIDAKRRNLKRYEKGTKRKQNEKKERKTAIIFALKRNEAKRKRKTAISLASKRNEAKQKRKNAIIFASKRNGSKIFSL
jgi:superfamily II DNA or RNA helicase